MMGRAAAGQHGDGIAQGREEAAVGQLGQHRDVDRSARAGHDVVEPIKHGVGLPEAASLLRVARRTGLDACRWPQRPVPQSLSRVQAGSSKSRSQPGQPGAT
ncbi:MAG: hypothetical protein WDO24_23930 [Pseudomonadota bacterium]